MKIACPYCGHTDYECFDRVGEGTMEPIDLCICENCDKTFHVVFTFNRVEKDDDWEE